MMQNLSSLSFTLFRQNLQFLRYKSTNVYSPKWVLSSLKHELAEFVSSKPPPVPICLIGDNRLRRSNDKILNVHDKFVNTSKIRLHYALEEFRRLHGYGRGISACQIGINLQMIAINLGYGSLTMINPKIVWSSKEMVTMWDDCMSIPQILVKKQRAASISVTYTDDDGNEQSWDELDLPVSELLQHEMDHLKGILNIDNPLKENGHDECIISMDEYNRNKIYFSQQVDYTIVPTVKQPLSK